MLRRFRQLSLLVILFGFWGAVDLPQVNAEEGSVAPFRLYLPALLRSVNPTQPNLTITAVKVQQGIMLAEANTVLVADRHTLVRVFVAYTAPLSLTLENTAPLSLTARLTRYVGGQPQDSLLSAPISAQTTSTDSQLASTLNFELPAAWLKPGTDYVVELDVDNVSAESVENDNRFPALGTQTFNFQTTRPLEIVIVPIYYVSPHGESEPKTDDLAYLEWYLHKVYPVATVNFTLHPTLTVVGDLNCTALDCGWQALLDQVTQVHANEIPEGRQMYYGLVNQASLRNCWSCPVTAGLGWLGGIPTAVGFTGLFTNGDEQAGQVLSHELGHNFNREHASCGVSDGDPAYPYADGVIGQWGYDFDHHHLIPPLQKDFMSYCDTGEWPYQWTSDYTYQAIFKALQAQSTTPRRALAETLWISGRLSTTTAYIAPITRQSAPLNPIPTGEYRLELVDAQGAVLATQAFAPIEVGQLRLNASRPAASEAHTLGFGFYLPYHPNAVGVRVYHGDTLLFSGWPLADNSLVP